MSPSQIDCLLHMWATQKGAWTLPPAANFLPRSCRPDVALLGNPAGRTRVGHGPRRGISGAPCSFRLAGPSSIPHPVPVPRRPARVPFRRFPHVSFPRQPYPSLSIPMRRWLQRHATATPGGRLARAIGPCRASTTPGMYAICSKFEFSARLGVTHTGQVAGWSWTATSSTQRWVRPAR